jgi:hypothetical protein
VRPYLPCPALLFLFVVVLMVSTPTPRRFTMSLKKVRGIYICTVWLALAYLERHEL